MLGKYFDFMYVDFSPFKYIEIPFSHRLSDHRFVLKNWIIKSSSVIVSRILTTSFKLKIKAAVIMFNGLHYHYRIARVEIYPIYVNLEWLVFVQDHKKQQQQQQFNTERS